MKKCGALSIWFVLGVVSSASASQLIPIDPSLFSIISGGATATWSGNTLTLDFSNAGPLYGGFTQTPILSTVSDLPANIQGISLRIMSSLSHPRLSFGYDVYDSTNHGQGAIALFNYANASDYDLTTFTVETSGLGNPTSSQTNTFIGPDYSPLSLPSILSTYPRFSLDFRGDGYDGADYLPGTVTFSDVNWIVATVPEPTVMGVFVLAAILVLRPRRHVRSGVP
jgi:hypothetical protein